MTDEHPASIEIVIKPRTRDLGGFTVGRILPYAKRRMVGPFIFLDEMGPADFAPGTGIDVRPHPHIGLATVTYLFDGELRHRDDLGFDQLIRPGDVNWMTAGRGIVHSERTDGGPRQRGQHMHGMQSWVALPDDAAETDPGFFHHPKETLPVISQSGCEMRLIAGTAFGATSPVKTYSPIFYLGVEANTGATVSLPDDYEDRALYVVSGKVSIDGQEFSSGSLLVFQPNTTPEISVLAPLRAMLLGGAPLGERHIWWNLVATSKERIEKAKTDWRNSCEAGFENSYFSLPAGETEFIPLPDE